MKLSTLDLGGGMTASAHRGGPSGRYFVGYSKGVSWLFYDIESLRRFLRLPPGTPSRQAFDEWANSLEPDEPTTNESSN
jgi:hypothetical protein